MRSAPLGAFFAGDPATIVEQATRSAEVTHAHPDGQAGAIAVALAASFISQMKAETPFDREQFFDFVLTHTPDSRTRANIVQARDLPTEYSVDTAAAVLGNGSQITAPDTVPFCLWCVAQSPTGFEQTMWTTIAGSGDMDTTCAITGGIVSAGASGQPPAEWIRRREPLPNVRSTMGLTDQ